MNDWQKIGLDLAMLQLYTLEELEVFISKGGGLEELEKTLKNDIQKVRAKGSVDLAKMKKDAIRKLSKNELVKDKVIDIDSKRTLVKQQLVRTERKTTIQYHVLMALFLISDEDGFCSYEDIETFLEQSGKSKKTGREMRKRILTAVEGIERFVEINCEEPTDMIEAIDGKGLRIKK